MAKQKNHKPVPSPCDRCDYVSPTPQGLGQHKRWRHGVPGQTRAERLSAKVAREAKASRPTPVSAAPVVETRRPRRASLPPLAPNDQAKVRKLAGSTVEPVRAGLKAAREMAEAHIDRRRVGHPRLGESVVVTALSIHDGEVTVVLSNDFGQWRVALR